MFCKNCGGEFENGSKFCPYCGDKVTPVVAQETAAPEVKQPAAPVQTPVESFVKPPVTEYAPQGGYVPQGGYNPGFVPGAPAPVKKKKSKKALIFVVLFAIIAVIAGILFGTGAFNTILAKTGITSPTYEAFEAAKKTVFESESASISFYDDLAEIDISFGDGLDGLKVYVEDEGYAEFGIKDGTVYMDGEEEISVGDMISYVIGQDTAEVLDLGDIEDLADRLLNGKIDEKAFADIYNTVIRGAANRYAKIMYIDAHTYSEDEMMQYVKINEATGDFEIDFDKIPASIDLPDYDTVMSLVKEFLTKGLTEEAISVTKDGNTYKYKVNCAEAIKCFADFVKENETLSKLVKDVSEIIDEEAEFFYEELEYLEEDFAEEGARLKGKVVIEKGYLTYFDVYGYEAGEDYDELLFKLEIKDINETEVKSSDIESIDTYSASDDYYW